MKERNPVIGRPGIFVGVLACLLWAVPVGSAEVSTKLVLPVFLKMVSHDESFTSNKGLDTLRMYFLYDYADPKSLQQYQEAQDYSRAKGDLTVSGVPVKLIGVQMRDADSTIKSAPDSSYAIIVCASGRGQDFRCLSPLLLSKGCHSFAIDNTDLKAGPAVSVEAKQYKTAVIVNLRAAQEEGSRFSAGLLSLCRIVDIPS